jgi:hypothetical protein
LTIWPVATCATGPFPRAAGEFLIPIFTALRPAFLFGRARFPACGSNPQAVSVEFAPRPAIINIMSYKTKEGKRIAIAAFIDEKHEHEWQIDVIHPNEIPKIASFCGWMRNEREEKEYESELRQKGTR